MKKLLTVAPEATSHFTRLPYIKASCIPELPCGAHVVKYFKHLRPHRDLDRGQGKALIWSPITLIKEAWAQK